MDPQVVLILILIALWLLLRHELHLRRYPNVACRRCKGRRRRLSRNFWGRTVSGPCPHCGGKGWYPRRSSR